MFVKSCGEVLRPRDLSSNYRSCCSCWKKYLLDGPSRNPAQPYSPERILRVQPVSTDRVQNARGEQSLLVSGPKVRGCKANRVERGLLDTEGMPQRRDQLPADAVNPDLPLDENQRTADFGPVWHDHSAWLMHQFLCGQDSGELSDWILEIVESRDVGRFKQLVKSYEIALDGIQAGPFNPTIKLTADYLTEAGESATTNDLLAFLDANGVILDESYVREIRRRLGR